MRYFIFSALFILIFPFTVSAVLTTEQVNSVKKRATDLLLFLDQLGPKINALPATPPPHLSTVFQLTGTGADFGYTSVSFGTLDPLDSPREIIVSLKNTTGRPAAYFGVRGLSPPFSFKGGVYPGTGGTCGQTIPASTCTLILRYAPSSADVGTTMGGVVRHLNYVYLSATPAGADFEEDSNSLVLVGYRRGGTNEANAIEELTAELQNPPETVLPGETARFLIRVGLKNGTDTRPVFFKNVTLSGVVPPFVVEKNECADTEINTSSCFVYVLFKPVVTGTFQQTFSISSDIGGGIQKQFSVAVSARTLLPKSELNANRDLLVVYNEGWSESIEAKNYYLANRPSFANANTLSIRLLISPQCTTLACLSENLEVISYQKIRDNVITPIISWLREHPAQTIQDIVLMRGLPTRTTDADVAQYAQGFSVQEMIRRAVAQSFAKEVFVTSLDMGSLAATQRYIDKVKTVYELMSVKSLIISAQNTAMSGTTYYFSDAYAPTFEGLSTPALDFLEALKAVRPSARIVHKGFKDTALISASDVSGLLHRGIYGYNWNRNYATDGTVQLTGNSGWYLAETVESFNGLWLAAGHQGNFIAWFSANAYGGTEYRNTPAAAVTHVLEPGSNGANSPLLFTCWDSGKPFAYCAWKSDRSGGRLQAVGDPWVTR